MKRTLFLLALIYVLFISSGLGAVYSRWPTVSTKITSDYGPRNTGSGYYFHPGIDIHASIGTNVYAAAPGTVFKVDDNNDSKEGKWIAILHADGSLSEYMHLSQINVTVGQVITVSDLDTVIGLSGNTAGPGNSVDPHLHFGVEVNGTNASPLKYLPYTDTGAPTITEAKPTTYENGGFIVVKGVTGIEVKVDSTNDLDLNAVEFYVDGKKQDDATISFDPEKNCSENTVIPELDVAGMDTFKWDDFDRTGLSDKTQINRFQDLI